MSALELKKKLIDTIQASNNPELLQEVYRLLQIEYEEEENVLVIPREVELKIEISRQQIRDGEVLTNEQVNHRIEEWLNEQ